MTPEDIDDSIKSIVACKWDDEAAHSMEDTLHQEVLRAIADGSASNPSECARRALLTLDVDFSRWCA